jgi:hypothetical protein
MVGTTIGLTLGLGNVIDYKVSNRPIRLLRYLIQEFNLNEV